MTFLARQGKRFKNEWYKPLSCDNVVLQSLPIWLPWENLCNAPFTRGVSINASRLLWMEWRQALPNWVVGPLRHFGSVAHCRIWKHLNFLSANAGFSQSESLKRIPLHRRYPIAFMQHQKTNVISCCHYDGRASTKLQTLPPSSVDADALWIYRKCSMGATVLTTERSPPEEGSVVAVMIKGVKKWQFESNLA